MLLRFYSLALVSAIWVSCLASTLRADSWCTGYLPGNEQTALPASALDFMALTHVIHFALIPNADGTLNSSANGITSTNTADLVSHAHAAGRKALICVGGAGSESAFQAATTSSNLTALVNNLTQFMAEGGYDGVDVDWEPLTALDSRPFTNLVNALRSALDEFPGHKMLTAAVGAYPPYGDPPTFQYSLFATLQDKFDQLNIMTYDLAGPYSGWVTWFNSPIYDGGFRFPSTGGSIPSVNGSVASFIEHGVNPAKLGIGVAFYGYVWTGGVTQPRQSWTKPPTATTPSFNAIMANYFQSNDYNWDTNTQAAYLSITNSNPANDMFISYDDEHTCQAKVSYARHLGLGGVMIWELAQDHQTGQPDALLQSIKLAQTAPGTPKTQITNQDASLSWTNSLLASRHETWTSNLTAYDENILTTTNSSASTQPLQIPETNSASHTGRLDRVTTP